MEELESLPILCFMETWLTSDDNDLLFPSHALYTIFRADRTEKRGGGVAILIPNVYPSFAPLNPVSLPEFEVVWAQVLLFRSWVRFGILYHPPTQSDLMPAHLIDYLTSVLDPLVPTL